jgi:hypothetical protein
MGHQDDQPLATSGLRAELLECCFAVALCVSVSESPVDRYLAACRAGGYTAYLTLRALGPLLGYLRRLGVAPEPVRPGPATAAEVLQEEYRAWLLGERGVQPAVARQFARRERHHRHRAMAGPLRSPPPRSAFKPT